MSSIKQSKFAVCVLKMQAAGVVEKLQLEHIVIYQTGNRYRT